MIFEAAELVLPALSLRRILGKDADIDDCKDRQNQRCKLSFIFTIFG